MKYPHFAECRRSFANQADRPAHPEEPTEEAEWIRNAADWLDPLVDRHWPKVDICVDDKLNDIDSNLE